jgi:fructokinase
MRLAGIEMGGTKTVVAMGGGGGRVDEEIRYPTTDPAETLGRAVDWLCERGGADRIGVAAFGPVGINPGSLAYGTMLDTPKPGWSGAAILAPLAAAFPDAHLVIETDVNAAALAEAKIGAAMGMEDVVYITIGTGIGAGILSGGRLIHGVLHPECGHFKVPRAPGDAAFEGVCPFHHDCLEGMASGPAMEKRWGTRASDLPAGHPAWEMQAWYLAHGILAFTAVVSPQRVILGGGVSQAEGLIEKVNALVHELAGGYFPQVGGEPYVVAPALGQQAGIAGALLLAEG